MATGKRASMREGPLAALFRKTAEDTSAEQRAEPAQQGPRSVRETPPAPEAPPAARRHAPRDRATLPPASVVRGARPDAGA